jgi:hypothetical protein
MNTLEVQTSLLVVQRDYAARLAAVLGNGADWEFRDEVAEDPECRGQCACGHQGLRWLFTIRHRTAPRSAVVGSSCILTYSGVNAEMVAGIEAAMAKIKERLAEARKKAAAANLEARVLAAIGEWSNLLWEIDGVAASWLRQHPGEWKPSVIYRVGSCEGRLARRTAGQMHPHIEHYLAGKLGKMKSAAGKLGRITNYKLKAMALMDDLRRNAQ